MNDKMIEYIHSTNEQNNSFSLQFIFILYIKFSFSWFSTWLMPTTYQLCRVNEKDTISESDDWYDYVWIESCLFCFRLQLKKFSQLLSSVFTVCRVFHTRSWKFVRAIQVTWFRRPDFRCTWSDVAEVTWTRTWLFPAGIPLMFCQRARWMSTKEIVQILSSSWGSLLVHQASTPGAAFVDPMLTVPSVKLKIRLRAMRKDENFKKRKKTWRKRQWWSHWNYRRETYHL